MKTKLSFVIVVTLLIFVTLTGWSCSPGAGVSNIEPADTNEAVEIPDAALSWQTYQNDEWGVRFQYPADWYYREYRETIEGEEEVTLAFSDTPLPENLPPEPVFPVTVFRDARTVDDIAVTYTEVVSSENITLGGKIVKKIVYFSNMLEQNDTVYLVPLRSSGALKFFALQEADYPAITENMIASIAVTE